MSRRKRRDSPRREGWVQRRGMLPYLKPPLAEQGRKRWTCPLERGLPRVAIGIIEGGAATRCGGSRTGSHRSAKSAPLQRTHENYGDSNACLISNRNSWFFCILEVLLQTGGDAQKPHSTSHDDNTSRFGMTDQRSRTIAVGETTHFLLFFLKSNKHTRTKTKPLVPTQGSKENLLRYVRCQWSILIASFKWLINFMTFNHWFQNTV